MEQQKWFLVSLSRIKDLKRRRKLIIIIRDDNHLLLDTCDFLL